MQEIKKDTFYDFAKQYAPDSEYHFVGEVNYHLLHDDTASGHHLPARSPVFQAV